MAVIFWYPTQPTAITKRDMIVTLFKSGKTVEEIRAIMNIKTRGQVYKYLWSAGTKRRQYTKLDSKWKS